MVIMGWRAVEGPFAKMIWGMVATEGLIQEIIASWPALYFVLVKGEVIETMLAEETERRVAR